MDTHIERVGVDVGFGDTKAVVKRDGKLEFAAFPSVVGPAQALSGAAVMGGRRSRAVRIVYGGTEYYVGRDALRHSRTLDDRQDRARIGSTEERVLLLAALAQLGVTDATIVTGLPVLWFGDRKLLARSWKGEHRVTVGRQDRTITIHALVTVPQPFGGFYSHFLDDSGRAIVEESEIMRAYGFLDVGWNTTDLTAIDKLQPVDKWGRGVMVGVRNVVGMVGDAIARQHGLAMDAHEVDAAIRAGYVEVYGERHDIARLVEDATAGLAGQVRAAATSVWGNGERLAKVLIFGGGAAVMGKALLKAFPRNGLLLDRPAMANAIGFCRFAQRMIWK